MGQQFAIQTSRFWRIAFWLVCIHFILWGMITSSQLQQSWNARMLQLFPWHSVGILKAITLWLFENSPSIWFILLTADLPALYLTWNLARRQRSPRSLQAYLLFVGGTVTLHISAIIYLSTLDALRTPQMTYVVERETASMFGINDLLVTLPAWLILAGILILKRPRQIPGLCPTCGYDLRASHDRCPECGSPISSAPQLNH